MPAAALEQDLIGTAFIDRSEDTVQVSKAECVPGTPKKQRDIHLVCILRFGSGLVADQVAVHVLEDGWMFESPDVIAAVDP